MRQALLPRCLLGLLALVCLTLTALGCEENLDPATPEGALHRLRDAVVRKDTAALLSYSSAATNEHLAQLHTLLKEQKAAIDERYAEDQREAARRTYPKGMLEAKDSAELFAAMVDQALSAQPQSEGLAFGLTALGQATVKEGRAMVPTQSGETVEFVQEDGEWKTTVFERQLERNLNKARLNHRALQDNLKVFEELKRRAAAKEAKVPAGDAQPPAAPGAPDAGVPSP